jgi:hypothetical protein
LSIERFITVAIAAISIVSVFYIPKEKYRLALISFLLFQAISWATSLIHIEIGLLENPVREFSRATQNSFINLFLFYPMAYTWFIIIFPHNKSAIKKILHYFIFVSFFVWYGYFRAVYTDLANLLKLSLFSHVILFYIEFSVYFITCRTFILWFSKKANLPAGG